MHINRNAILAGLAGATLITLAACGSAAAPHATAPRPAVTRTVTASPAPVRTVIRQRTVIREVPAAPAAPAPQSDPWAVVSEYYGDVTSGDYADAWNLLGPSFQASMGGYASFAAGYAGTGGQTVQEAGESGDQVTYYLESVNPDGSVQWYSGTGTVYGGLFQHADVTQLAGNPAA